MSQPSPDRSSPPVGSRSILRVVLRVLLVLVMTVVVLAGALAVYVWQYNAAIKRKELEETALKDLEQPKNLALQAVQGHEGVQAELGDPIVEKGDNGNLRRKGTGELNRSNAVFSFDVGGSRGGAVVEATAKQADGNWRIVEIKVKLAGGKTIAVPPPEKEAEQELEFKL